MLILTGCKREMGAEFDDVESASAQGRTRSLSLSLSLGLGCVLINAEHMDLR